MDRPSKGSSDGPTDRFDILRRYVRVRRIVKDKFVEFDLAIGEPSLYIELILPFAAFDSFCHHNNVIEMTDEQARQVDADMLKWCYGDQN